MKNRKAVSIVGSVLALVLSGFHSPLFGGLNQWTSRGPAGTAKIAGVVIAPDDESVVYAGSFGGGVYKSETGGQLWRRANEGLTDWEIRGLTMSPDDPLTLYAGTRGGSIFKTEDGGGQWVNVHKGERALFRILALPNDVVLAVTSEATLLRSTNGGASWTFSAIPCFSTQFLKVSRAGIVACGGPPIALSDDGGLTWRVLDGIFDGTAIAFGPDGSTYIANYDAVFRSADGRTQWERFAKLPDGVHRLRDIRVGGNGMVSAATDKSDSGTTLWEYRGNVWTPAVIAPDSDITAFYDGPSGRIYAASATHGIFTALETDPSWERVVLGMADSSVADVAVSPYQPSLLFATVREPSGFRSYRSQDPAGEWELLDEQAGNQIDVSPVSPNLLYANHENRLSRSSDGGDTWRPIHPEKASALALSPSDPLTLYAALADSMMARSTDGGHTWNGIMNNMPSGYSVYYGFDFEADIAVDPSDASIAYVGHEDGIFKTADGGARWTSLARVSAGVTVDPTDPSIVFARFNYTFDGLREGLSISRDKGRTWTDISPVSRVIGGLAIDPTDSSILYASSDSEIFRSDDRGETWSSFSHGLNGQMVGDLDIDATGHFLVAATSGGVHEYEISAVDVSPLPAAPMDLPTLLDRLIRAGTASHAGFVLPVAGVVEGLSGKYETDVRIENHRARAQQVLIAWVPREGDGAVSFFRLTVPARSQGAAEGFAIPNIVRRLGLKGVGTIVAIGVDAAGAFDPDASIDGSSRICSHTRNRNPVCEATSAVRADLFAPHRSASTGGMQQDAEFRTNVGITNLDARPHRYVVTASGERGVHSFEMLVPPFSLQQRSIPSADYGRLTLEVMSDDTWTPWLFYGSSIENHTALSTTRVGSP